MARLLIGNSFRSAVERWPFLHRCIWAVEAGLFGIFLLLTRCLPLPMAQATGNAIMAFFGPRQPKDRRVRRNLELAFPDKSPAEIEALGQGLWGNVGKVFAEYSHLPPIRRNVERHIQIIGAEHIERLVSSGRPGVMVSPHLGNWEMSGCAMDYLGLSLSVVYTPLQNPFLDKMIARSRQRGHGSGLLPRDDSMRSLLRELAAGRSVGLVMDQRVDSGVPVPMFGIDKLTTLIPARLALRHEIDLIAVRTERLTGGRFRVSFQPPIRPADTSATQIEQAMDMTRQINACFESWIRDRPQDWFVTQRLWPKDAEPPA